MKHELGRSLIEVLGVLAIGGVMTAGAIGAFVMVRENQMRKIAATEIEQIAKNVHLLMDTRGDYNGLSIEYLINAGALDNADAPIGDDNWSVGPTFDGLGFEIKLTGLSFSQCAYFTTALPKWASAVIVNGVTENPGSGCFSSQTNQITFVVQ